MTNTCRIVERAPTDREYRDICIAVGWGGVLNFDAARQSLANSLYCVVAECDDRAVGMGRIVGDAAIYFYIQDIAVLPAYQHKGIGTMIVDWLVAYLRDKAPEQAIIGLFAAEGTRPFYERHGFKVADNTGMYRVAPIGS